MRHDEAAAEATDSDETSAPMRRRKAHIRESNEAHLLACAEAVFAERGLDGASTAMIAERAGLPKANLHYYFPTKLALYRRVLEDLFEDWHRAAGSFEGGDDPVEAIGGYVRAKMALSRRRPLGSKVWANEIIHGAEHMQDILSERVKPWFDTRVQVIDSWIARGLLAPIDAHALIYLAVRRIRNGRRATRRRSLRTTRRPRRGVRACVALHDPLDRDRRRLAAADAQRCDAALQAMRLERGQQRHHHARTRRTDRMA